MEGLSEELTHSLSKGTIPDPLYGLPFPKIGGSQSHPKGQNSNRYYLRNGYYGLQIWLYTFTGSIRTKTR